MSCCGGSPVSRIRREAKSLSAPLMRNWVFSATGGSTAGAGGDIVGGEKDKPQYSFLPKFVQFRPGIVASEEGEFRDI